MQEKTRDPERTKAKILQAAFREFLEHGRAGARIDRIADDAGVNKANIYHYFDSKDGLMDALLSQQLTQVRQVRAKVPDAFRDRLAYFQDQQYDDAQWLRLVTWEALEFDGAPVVAEAERAAAWQPLIQGMRQQMSTGKLPKMDPAQLQLSWVALVTFPVAFPQFTRMITGMDVDDPKFRRARKRFLKRFADVFTGDRNVDR